jgi:hypothetical protein
MKTEMFTITNDWRDKVKAAFDPMDTVIFSNDRGADILQEETNTLLKLLWARLDLHIEDKVPQSKRKHWIWKFVRKNLSRVAAAMILFDHAVHDLERFATDPTKCLLRNVSSQGRSFVPLVVGTSDSFTQAANKMEGCYLYFDREEAEWIRSGKVCGRTFAERHKEHKKGSELKCEISRESRFYTRYPSKVATAGLVRLRRGFFDDLTMYCGLAFERGSPSLHHLLDDENGIFCWEKDCLSSLLKMKIPGAVTLNDIKLHMVSYLCELGYDLMISPRANISKSPGFESPLGVF